MKQSGIVDRIVGNIDNDNHISCKKVENKGIFAELSRKLILCVNICSLNSFSGNICAIIQHALGSNQFINSKINQLTPSFTFNLCYVIINILIKRPIIAIIFFFLSDKIFSKSLLSNLRWKSILIYWIKEFE